MTMPRYQNCPHQDSGWCLDCVDELHEDLLGRRAQMLAAIGDMDQMLRTGTGDSNTEDGIERVRDALREMLAAHEANEARRSRPVEISLKPVLVRAIPLERSHTIYIVDVETAGSRWHEEFADEDNANVFILGVRAGLAALSHFNVTIKAL